MVVNFKNITHYMLAMMHITGGTECKAFSADIKTKNSI